MDALVLEAIKKWIPGMGGNMQCMMEHIGSTKLRRRKVIMNSNKIKINLNNINDIKKFIKISTSFMSDIDVITDRTVVDGKSILALLSLDLSQDIFVKIISDDITENRKFDAAMEEFR